MRKLLLLMLMALCVVTTQAQVPAFPGAEGHGRYVTGGRGGEVRHVTNLNDSGTGSLRAAVSGSTPKIVVFDVGGVISLESDLNIGANTTIAGQTAPSPGITIRYYTVRPNGDNIIMRFIRVRRGQEKDVNDGADAIWTREHTGLIIDHCSFSWSIDEVASFYDNNNFTMQWCTVAESLNNAGHGKGAHGYGGIWGGKLASFHHNLIAHVGNRAPRFNGARYGWTGYTSNSLYSTYNWANAVEAENVDFRNCVMYNWTGECYGGPGGGQINIVNNYYKGGPATSDNKAQRVTVVSVGNSGNSTEAAFYDMTSRYYISGNTTQTNKGTITQNRDWNGVSYDSGVYTYNSERYSADPNNYYTQVTHTDISGVSCVPIKMTEPAPYGEVTTHSAATAFTKVLDYAGASLYRDEVDARYKTEATDGTATYTGTTTGTAGQIDLVSDVNGYTEDNFGTSTREKGFDSDNDGMPDAWETEHGLDPNDASDASTYTLDTKRYFTNLEVYLSKLVEDIMLAGNADAEETTVTDEYYPLTSTVSGDTGSGLPTDVTATWDFQNRVPASLSEVALQGNTGEIASDVDGVSLYVDATNGKFNVKDRSSDAQVNNGTIIRVPVGSTKDVVTVTTYPGYHNLTIAGTAMAADQETYSPKSSDVSAGYVEIVATGSVYLYNISVYLASDLVEKALYSTNFTEWGDYETKAATTVTTASWSTKYSNETLTFSIYNTQIGATNFNTGKFPDWTGGMLMAAKSADPYIITSSLKSITKVHFMHGATGGNRGWRLEAKGDGDADWVVLSESVANPAVGCDVNVDVNRTNCQLRFTNLTSNQNAYLLELDIYGLVDQSRTPTLGSFDYNGETYIAGDIFAEDANGNMTATIEVTNSVDLPSASSPISNVVIDNGQQSGDITYTATTEGVDVSLTITANGETKTYIASFIHKPYYTLSYYDTTGQLLDATQQVEKDAAITTLRASDDVTVADGQAFRGWFVSADGGQKYTTADVITADTKLYAVATDIEVESTTARYNFTLTDKYFYDEDHEAFNATGGEYHDGTHGWTLAPTGKIDLLVGGKAYIIVKACRYTNASATLTLSDADGNAVATAPACVSTDGESVLLAYDGPAGTVTLTTDLGATYLHSVTIINVGENDIAANAEGFYVVNANDGDHFLSTLEIANAAASSDKRTYIFVPDGTYDLGEAVLNPVSGDNISIIGQSMDKTIIVNKAPVEGIGVSATLYITGENTYLQDLTLQNAYPYYDGGQAGRAVVIQDKGHRTICKNVKMLSYQDTYYSNNNSGQFYFETSDIHGTVDFICGGGTVFFNECTLTVEPRNADGSGECTITAPAGNTTYGYVFSDCTIDCLAAKFNLGRAWNNSPRCAYINTTLLQPSLLNTNRWTLGGMNVAADKFVEYNTMDESGAVISPSTWELTFTKDANSKTYETILTADEAATYSLANVFTDWTPAECTVQKTMGTVAMDSEETTLSWTAVDGAIAYAVFLNDVFVGMTTGTTYAISEPGDYTVRAANAYGGFGKISNTTTGIDGVTVSDADVVSTEYYNVQGVRVSESAKGVLIQVRTLKNGTKHITKLMR